MEFRAMALLIVMSVEIAGLRPLSTWAMFLPGVVDCRRSQSDRVCRGREKIKVDFFSRFPSTFSDFFCSTPQAISSLGPRR
jgi:hypothetical protein